MQKSGPPEPLRKKTSIADPPQLLLGELFVNEARQAAKRLEGLGRDIVVINLNVELLFKTGHDGHHRHRVEFRDTAKEPCRGIELDDSISKLQSLLQHPLYPIHLNHLPSSGPD